MDEDFSWIVGFVGALMFLSALGCAQEEDVTRCDSHAGCPQGEYCSFHSNNLSYCGVVREAGGSEGGGYCRPLGEHEGIPAQDEDLTICGCDGQTYQSIDQAANKGVSVDTYSKGSGCEGATRQKCGIGQEPCPSDEICLYPLGSHCGEKTDQTGECVTDPIQCPVQSDPVCGCDGNTYRNECKARLEGVSISHLGQCEEMESMSLDVPSTDSSHTRCGGEDGATCRDGEFCYFTVGTCGAGGAGVCRAEPSECDASLTMPVCGCNGRSYANPCAAYRDGVSLRNYGSCRSSGVNVPDELTEPRQ